MYPKVISVDLITVGILMATLLASCSLFNENEPEELEFESVFQYRVDGEMYWADPRAAIFPTGADSALDVFGVRFDSSAVPYLNQLSFRVVLEEGQNVYSVLLETRAGPPFQIVGGSFSERDGDAPIAQYFPTESELNYLEINRGLSEFGATVFGEFAMVVVVEDNLSEFGRRNRRFSDTLRITDGRFRVLLERPYD